MRSVYLSGLLFIYMVFIGLLRRVCLLRGATTPRGSFREPYKPTAAWRLGEADRYCRLQL